MIITSNLVFSQWDRIFKDPMTTAAAIDRLVHHAVILEMTGTSLRAEDAHAKHALPGGTPPTKPPTTTPPATTATTTKPGATQSKRAATTTPPSQPKTGASTTTTPTRTKRDHSTDSLDGEM